MAVWTEDTVRAARDSIEQLVLHNVPHYTEGVRRRQPDVVAMSQIGGFSKVLGQSA